MLLREVDYARPETVEDAIALLAGSEGARPLAGGQTLVNVMKARAASPEVLVDLGRLEELRTIRFGADGMLELGAMATYAQLISSSEVEVARPILGEVAATIADVQVRNRGTIGGNVCVNDPTNHLPPLLVALDARFTIRGQKGERTVDAEEFFQGVYLTAVGEGELLTKISVPPATSGTGDGFAAVTIGRHGTCIVEAAATVTEDGGVVSTEPQASGGAGSGGAGAGAVRVVLGCVAPTPARLTEMEERLAGSDLSEESVRAAAAGVGTTLDPPSDVHGSADYRRALAETLAARAVLQAAARRKR